MILRWFMRCPCEKLLLFAAKFSHLMRFDAVCSAVFVIDFLLKFYMFSAAQFSSKISLVDVAFCWTVMRFPYRDLCFLGVMKCHEISSWGFMLLGGYAISLWLCVAFSWIIVWWDLMFCVCRNANSCWDFLLFRRLRDVLMRSSHGFCRRFLSREEICVRAVLVSCRCEMSLWLCRVWQHSFLMRYPDETWFFLSVMSCCD
jgi:hypothetical protein